MDSGYMEKLQTAIGEITEIAAGFGLDFYPMRYEICPADIIYTFGAYGMPTRYSHWSFGKAFHKMKTQYDFGLSKIYELVINSNPCYAFLLEGNSLIQNKLIVAHVLGHCDFFKNNARFRNTNRGMVDSMSATADRIAEYELRYGMETVEKFIDAVLAVQEHIDPLPGRPRTDNRPDDDDREGGSRKAGPYDDLWNIEAGGGGAQQDPAPARPRIPREPEKDLLRFIGEQSTTLKDWERDVLSALRDEMLYFWPQIETKIMNEGWASYWHQRIIRELDITPEETVEFAKLNASVLSPSRHSLNPYYLGLKMLEDIEKRWDNPTQEERERFGIKPGSGKEKLFEVRETESDVSFLRNYLTQELVKELDLYVYEKKGTEWIITDKSWESVRDRLVASRVNGGFPYIVVKDGDYGDAGELLLSHVYEGVELDLKYVERTLPHVVRLWGRPVQLETVVEEKQLVFRCDGKTITRVFR